MVVAISCSAKPHKYMGGQPFWLAKYSLDSTPHHTLVLRRQVFAALHAFVQRGQYQGTSSRGAMRRSPFSTRTSPLSDRKVVIGGGSLQGIRRCSSWTIECHGSCHPRKEAVAARARVAIAAVVASGRPLSPTARPSPSPSLSPSPSPKKRGHGRPRKDERKQYCTVYSYCSANGKEPQTT
jgi:hypothetical protein